MQLICHSVFQIHHCDIYGTLSGETRHQFSVQKRSNANSVTLPSANSKNQTMKAGNII
jgi:hypothetical protein